MNIFVLDGNENQAVASVRSLARVGHRVLVGAASSWSKAGWSRFASGTFTYSAPDRNAFEFVNSIATEARKQPGTLVLPMTELSMLPLSEHREVIFAAGGKLILPPHETVLKAVDKQYTTGLARSLGIATPQTWAVSSAFEAAELADSIMYPVILKPRSTNQVAGGQLRATGKPLYASNPEQFRSAYAEISGRSANILVQQFVEGMGCGYFALMREGEVRAEFFHRRLRDVRPTGSGSSLRVSIEPQPEIRDAGRAILQTMRWHGAAMVEFRVRRDGKPVFVEVNGRFWNSLPLAIHAGVDFPRLLVEMAETGDAAGPKTYRAGVRCRWFLGDVRHLLETFAGAPAGYPGNFPKRLPTLLKFLKPVPGTYHDNFSFDDPLPAIGDWVHFAARRVPGLLKTRTAQPVFPNLGVLHAHSKYSDGEFTLSELRNIFQKAGCKFLCITDHADAFDEIKLERYLAECEQLSDDDFRFVPGLEYSCEGRMHILGYGCTRLAHSTDPQSVIAHIHEHDGIAVIAHPADRMFATIEDFLVLPHGIEVWNTKYDGQYAPRPGTFALLHRLQQRKPSLRAFFGQDLHWKRQFRGMFTSLSCAATTRNAVLSALEHGEFSGVKSGFCLPASGELTQELLLRFELERRKSDRLRRVAANFKTTLGHLGFSVPPAVKSQLRRIF